MLYAITIYKLYMLNVLYEPYLCVIFIHNINKNNVYIYL